MVKEVVSVKLRGYGGDTHGRSIKEERKGKYCNSILILKGLGTS